MSDSIFEFENIEYLYGDLENTYNMNDFISLTNENKHVVLKDKHVVPIDAIKNDILISLVYYNVCPNNNTYFFQEYEKPCSVIDAIKNYPLFSDEKCIIAILSSNSRLKPNYSCKEIIVKQYNKYFNTTYNHEQLCNKLNVSPFIIGRISISLDTHKSYIMQIDFCKWPIQKNDLDENTREQIQLEREEKNREIIKHEKREQIELRNKIEQRKKEIETKRYNSRDQSHRMEEIQKELERNRLIREQQNQREQKQREHELRDREIRNRREQQERITQQEQNRLVRKKQELVELRERERREKEKRDYEISRLEEQWQQSVHDDEMYDQQLERKYKQNNCVIL